MSEFEIRASASVDSFPDVRKIKVMGEKVAKLAPYTRLEGKLALPDGRPIEFRQDKSKTIQVDFCKNKIKMYIGYDQSMGTASDARPEILILRGFSGKEPLELKRRYPHQPADWSYIAETNISGIGNIELLVEFNIYRD